MELYGQEPEAELLAAFVSRLEHRAVIDVGAERGDFAEALLRAGAEEIHAIESNPENVRFLRERFRDEARVKIHGPVPLQWHTLAALVQEGELSEHAGVLHVGDSRNVAALVEDLAINEHVGGLDWDIVALAQAQELSAATTDQSIAALPLRGFTHFAFLGRREQGTIVHWDDESAPRGSAGQLVFLHATVLGRTLPVLLEHAVRIADGFSDADGSVRASRGHAIEGLRDAVAGQAAAADERLEVIEELLLSIKDVSRERDLQARVARERLAVIEDLERDRDIHAAAAAARLEVLQELERQHEALES